MSIIKTSYYYAVKHKANDYFKVAISRTAPADEYDYHALSLAPDSDTLWAYKNEYIDDKEYTKQYLDKLNRILDNGTLQSIIENLKAHDKVLLLCYEGKSKFCHRHILADFLNEHFKVGISEL